jgi:acetylornithine deacetylase/succinyl-diaminopimelate desuccinylase-like protein
MVEVNSGADKQKTLDYVESHWDNWYVKGLSEFIEIPNLSPLFDAEFHTNGEIWNAAKLVDSYIQKLEIKGLTKHEFAPVGKPPMIVYVVEAQGPSKQNVMLYGHLDKQPWMLPWREGLGPCKAVVEGEWLFGRGGADDGYSPFSCMLAIKNLQVQGANHPRCALVLETEEESGSPNLLELLDISKEAIGNPDIMICMDSGAFDYERLWITSSLRGITIFDLKVEAAGQGYHSGEVGGVIPETFAILRSLLDRIDNSATQEMCAELAVATPEHTQKEAKFMAELSGDVMWRKYKTVEGMNAVSHENLEELYLNNVWRASMSVTGQAGLPDMSVAGNVVRPATSVRLSIRLSPV